MDIKIINLHKRIGLNLATGLENGKITEEETLAYMIYIESLGENEDLINKAVFKIWKKDGIFGDIVSELILNQKIKQDLDSANILSKQIKTK
ncbi:MAG: hypothetical protein PHN31_00710 [Candidatus Gracilibacteria bacterium]|nr:hypothetical protein [Candidatus Gracilibacteria bacterium]